MRATPKACYHERGENHPTARPEMDRLRLQLAVLSGEADQRGRVPIGQELIALGAARPLRVHKGICFCRPTVLHNRRGSLYLEVFVAVSVG